MTICRVFSHEIFLLESIQSQGIRFRLYTNERFKREKLLAESTVMFGLVNLDEDMCKIIPLERAYVISSFHHCQVNILVNESFFSHRMIQILPILVHEQVVVHFQDKILRFNPQHPIVLFYLN